MGLLGTGCNLLTSPNRQVLKGLHLGAVLTTSVLSGSPARTTLSNQRYLLLVDVSERILRLRLSQASSLIMSKWTLA